ncbi:hypothetical protein SGP15004_40160 [Shigella flexneri]|nr:hypothetical protein SFy_2581 [Shigella flexneri 2003036]AIL40900.1 hypothetical protein SFyv_2641 [Shigella flexneri Shi06HN006]EFS15010.1 hypothetical protein SF2457T_0971 [Shigella flexneri 2a str. 2457T]EGJ90362.1 hypothetical protein SFK671_1742 [Shigella flexneri K-671]EGJ97832.1 hypothetical protein SF293071_1293 [Shigella flexneri 2930-71]EGK36847.1 hypothetical protein SFK304_2457 [Shigella flexneri K-304]EIQ29372.1 hypothetical protein SFK404_2015 [Shigella flexneri K-404]OXB267
MDDAPLLADTLFTILPQRSRNKSKSMFEFIEQRIESRDVVLYIYHLKEN